MRGNAGLRVATLDRKHSKSVKGLAKRVKDPAQHFRPGARERRALAGGNLASDVKSGHVPEGHQKQPVLAKSDDLGAHAETVPRGSD
jgi:hypothetical protein